MPEQEIVPDPTYDPSRPHPDLQIIYRYPLANVPGKTVLGIRVAFPPNGSTPPHRHGGASVAAYVLEGTVLNKMNDLPTRVIKAGDSWYEAPGCHHKVSDNASQTDGAVLVATFVIDSDVLERDGMGALIQIDEEFREGYGKGG